MTEQGEPERREGGMVWYSIVQCRQAILAHLASRLGA